MKSHLVCIEVQAPDVAEEQEVLDLVQKALRIGLDEAVLAVDRWPVVDTTYYDLKNIKLGNSFVVYEKQPVHRILTVGQKLKHCKHGVCELVHVSNDGTSLRLKDKDGQTQYAISPKDCEYA